MRSIVKHEGTVPVFRQKFPLEDAIGPMHVRLKLLHACGRWHSSQVSTFLTSPHCKLRPNPEGTVRVFRQKFTLEDAIGSHACSLEANTRVTNGIPLGSSLLLPVCTVNSVQTLKAAVTTI